MATSSLAAKVTNIDGRIAMKRILKKQESFVTENVNRDADLLKSSDDNADVNVGNPSLGDDVNNKMGDADAEKIKSYKDTIKQEKRVNFRKELEDTQSLIESNPYDGGLREKEAKYLKEFVEASMDEERFVKQKAKVKWLAEGDANTKGFDDP
ncbi:hypothetical protein QVD17_00326 [Tagetes erecta]|uniref:Uncharacterized protein n=1 Tax=Tagetes erecta TaxID=13708 RepID=A0AAD8L324_TARER|nr:hypothetical protein QVD17_00326 [Tagetes erecta]